ncbi:MAG: ABC transporter ATP-binding protein [Candidatus Melainabacteria bacterium]|nr:MAG: ABC transporter ATP-binding protein [Candidatus Melainabacteria bacterium]
MDEVPSQFLSASNRPTLLAISELSFAFENHSKSVIERLSLAVNEGEIVSILGRSGCGKSTLLNLIAGLMAPQRGQIKIAADSSVKTKIGYIFQQDALLPWRTVAANLNLAREIGGIDKATFDQRRAEFFSSFHLEESIMKNYPSQLSGGMKQRVSIIQTLLFNPDLLLLDEPFSALDFYTRLSLETEFYNLARTKGITVLLVTHDIEEAIALSDRIILLGNGGEIRSEIQIDFGDCREPELVRALPSFGNYFRIIWDRFKEVSA